jgi:hypothetical protein
MIRWVACALVLLTATELRAQEPAIPNVAEMMKPFLVDAIPAKLYEHSRNWGKTSPTPHAIHWHGLRPEIVSTPRNDGHWQKVRISPRNLASSFDFRMSPAKRIDAERQSFQIFLSFVATVDYEHQLWESDVRLYSGNTRARIRILLTMDVENTLRLDTKKKALVPDMIFRLRATSAKLAYKDLVVEHTAGVGGSAARVIGEAIEGLVHELQPNLEQKLLDKAGAAVVRAADTREIRIGLSSLLK